MTNNNRKHIVDDFIPKNILSDPELSRIGLIRARTMVIVMMFSIAAPILLLFCVMFLHLFTERDFSLGMIFIGAILAGMVTLQLTFNSYGNLYLTAAVYSVLYAVMTIFLTSVSGGWHSPVMLLVFCAPMITFLIAGRREGILMVYMVGVIGAVFLALELKGIPLPQVMPVENADYIQGITWFVALTILLMLLTSYNAVLVSRKSISNHRPRHD